MTVTVLCLAVIMLGFYAFHKLSIDFLPNIDVPKLIVKIECPDANARDVEELVTQRIEATLNTLNNIHKIRSISRDGIAFIHIEFNWGTDMDVAFIKVRGKLDRMQGSLPDFAERPTLLRFDPASTPIMTLVVTGERIEHPKSAEDFQNALVELKEVASSIIKRRLEQIDGIAQALVAGGLEREIRITFNQQKCLAFNIGFDAIESALQRFNINTTGGSIREGNFQYPLRIQAEFTNIQEIYDTPVKYTNDGHIIFLRDIARVEDSFKERTGFTQLNGKEVITLFLFKEAGANTVETSRIVYQTLARLFYEYPEFRILPVFDQAEFIQESIDNVLQSLFLGGIFAFFILFYFLNDLKSPLLVGISIPISIITTLIFMYFLDINFNIISLGGLALGIGMLVDNSIVVLENIYRYKEMGFSLREAAVKGTKEVSLAITASTFTTISVFLPLVMVKGLAGELFYDQSITITVALTISLIVSVTVLSVLAARTQNPFTCFSDRWNFRKFSPLKINPKHGKSIRKFLFSIFILTENIFYSTCYFVYQYFLKYVLQFLQFTIQRFQIFFEKLINFYEENLQRALDNRQKVLIIVLLFIFLSGGILLFLKTELMPPVDRKQLVISAELPPGAGLNATITQVIRLEKILLQQKEVKRILSSVGITENILDQTYQSGENKAILDLEIEEDANTFEVERKVSKLFERFPEMALEIRQREFIFEQLFQQEHVEFDVKISGAELATLDSLNQQIVAFMESASGFENILSSLKKGEQAFTLKPIRDKLIRYGISLAQLTDYLRKQIQGSVPTQFIDFSDKIDIKVENSESRQVDLVKLLQMNFVTTLAEQKIYVPVNQLVRLEMQDSYVEVLRENQNRMISINAILNGTSYSEAKKLLENHVAQMDIPGGYLVEIGASRQTMLENYRSLSLIFIISMALVYFILSAQFESLKIPLIIIVAIPLAFIGISLTLLLTGNSLNVMSFIGSIILIGIVVNDSIVKVDFIHRQHLEGSDVRSAIISAGQKRFRPIVMTTVTTICGLLPMAIASGSGAELRQPLAWVIIGGIFMATALTLIVIPVIYSFMVK